MPDCITFVQKVCDLLVSRRLFAVRPEFYDRSGVRPDRLREYQTRLGRLLGTRLFSRVYPGLPGRVHIHDSMLPNDFPEEIGHYIHVGQSAMRNIETALAAAARSFEDIHAVLDMACGYGRVQRWLARGWDSHRDAHAFQRLG